MYDTKLYVPMSCIGQGTFHKIKHIKLYVIIYDSHYWTGTILVLELFEYLI